MSARANDPPGTPAELTTAQQSRLRELFDAAVSRSPDDRAAFLDGACGEDQLLRLELEQLLAAHDSTGAWLDRPVIEPDIETAETASWEGRRVGPYQIVRELGTGGMGTVYLAERTIGRMRQQVALKIIRPVFITNSEMLRRFGHEREILASLDHPNIARLLDIGSTEDGVPYLVMDYVQGEPLDIYCDNRRLGITERLGLFCDACAAIQYAHTKGVVHRDLKPGNILVTSQGTIKLLDFGIARIVRSEAAGATLTQSGAAVMTIEYASPEQVRGEAAGPRSDVYSLGVLLYELLTGCRPYQADTRLVHAIARAICEEQPVPPSSAACDLNPATLEHRAGLRSEKPNRFRRRLSGDLDSIILKALRKEPEWRYESAAFFSQDIGRHLAGERVFARQDTFRYRAERVMRRVLYPSDGVFHSHGMLMLTAGALGIVFLLQRHQILTGRTTEPHTVMNSAILGAWLLWSMWEARRMMRAGRFSALDRQSWIVFTVITVSIGIMTVVSNVGSTLSPEAVAIFWNIGLASGLMIIGLQASRMMTAGGVALLASAVLATVWPEWLYLWLAGGLFFGMVLPGLMLTMQARKPAAVTNAA